MGGVRRDLKNWCGMFSNSVEAKMGKRMYVCMYVCMHITYPIFPFSGNLYHTKYQPSSYTHAFPPNQLPIPSLYIIITITVLSCPVPPVCLPVFFRTGVHISISVPFFFPFCSPPPLLIQPFFISLVFFFYIYAYPLFLAPPSVSRAPRGRGGEYFPQFTR